MTDVTASWLSSNIDESTKQKLYERGAFIIVVDLPVGSEFGIDCAAWRVGEKFKGMKMVPPGAHVVYFSGGEKSNEFHNDSARPRIGFMHTFQPREILVRKWDKESEDIDWSYEIDDEQLERLRNSLKTMDSELAPYPFEKYKKWFSLTQYVNQQLIERIQPTTGRISSQALLISKETKQSMRQQVDREHPNRERFRDEQGLPIMYEEKESKLNFTWIDKNKVPKSSNEKPLTAAEISLHARDWSNYTEKLIADKYNGDYKMLLGEMQLSFILFFVMQMYEGFDQWKRLVNLITQCNNLTASHESLYLTFLSAIYHQLNECPQDFFTDIVTAENFLSVALGNLFANIDSNDEATKQLKDKAIKMKKYLEHKFKVKFDDPDDCK